MNHETTDRVDCADSGYVVVVAIRTRCAKHDNIASACLSNEPAKRVIQIAATSGQEKACRSFRIDVRLAASKKCFESRVRCGNHACAGERQEISHGPMLSSRTAVQEGCFKDGTDVS